MEDLETRFQTEERFTEALKQGEFLLFCQQIVPMATEQADHKYLEIFVRFREEEDRLIPPGTFFPVLKAHHLTPMLDRWVVGEALRWTVEKQSSQPNWQIPRFDFNLAEDTIGDREFPGYVRDQLKATRIPPNRLWFEIEAAHMAQFSTASRQAITSLKALGCPIAVSDFFGSETVAKQYKDAGVQIVKLAGHLVRDIHKNASAQSKLVSISESCRKLGLVTIAQFVEEREALAVLKQAGIHYAQGYAVAIPMPLGTVT
jgi:EAL domain-containing protein (putative c-di-GMP-specific phosphodiesterase class I)